jgi:hypothetical protein
VIVTMRSAAVSVAVAIALAACSGSGGGGGDGVAQGGPAGASEPTDAGPSAHDGTSSGGPAAMRLLGHGDPGSLSCGSGIGNTEKLQAAARGTPVSGSARA